MTDTTSKIDKFNILFEKHKDAFENTMPGLHNFLWQTIINGVAAGGDSAFTILIIENTIGIADRNIQGYTPTGLRFKNNPTNVKRGIVRDLNKEVLGLDVDKANKIVITTL